MHLHQLDNLKQTGSVADYYTKFEQLVHSILLYNDSYDDVYLVTHFLGGLKEEIRAPIALHRPKDVITMSSLAMLQEEEVETRRRLVADCSDTKEFTRPSSKSFSALDRNKAVIKKDDNKKPDKPAGTSKMAVLMAFRKANGLCYTCAEKWTGRSHTCPAQIPLHVVQEVMELFQLDIHSDADNSHDEDSVPEDCVMTLQKNTIPGQTKKRKTMRFKGLVNKQEFLVLLDSGSAGTFISQDLANHFKDQLQPCEELQFATANGSPMISNTCIPQFQWFIQGQSFTYDVRGLPLQCFYIIIGADWLEDHSPTWIHWKKKKMSFPLNGKRIQLLGISNDLSTCKPISVPKHKGLLRRKAVFHTVELRRIPMCTTSAELCTIQEASTMIPDQDNVPLLVQQLIQQYSHLFQEPTELPPLRDDDHHIPLIPGAQPVNIRPYRYSPQQKTEIEKADW